MVDLNHQRINNRSVGPTGRTSFSEVSYWLVFGGCIVMLLLAYASLHDRILAINYEIERIKENNAELAEINNALRAEYSVLVNPQEIEAVAKGMGLISANEDQVTILEGEPSKPGPNQVAQTRHRPEIMYE
jgi:cell division protein FtsL